MCPISPVQYPMFQPAMRQITNISQARLCTVTTSFDHNYYTGLIIRLDIPLSCSMYKLDDFQGEITVVDATSFILDLDTTFMDAFSNEVGAVQFPQVIPIGQNSFEIYQATRNVLPYP